MLLSDYDYELPPELIASYPLASRTDSRLLVVDVKNQSWEDRKFTDLAEYVTEGDCLVFNTTKVIPARLLGHRSSGGKVEILLTQRLQSEDERWVVLAGPAKKARRGEKIYFDERLSCTVIEELEQGARIVEFHAEGSFEELLNSVGAMPLPPYMQRDAEAIDRERYQTVYARTPGAVAAPTAGLHFSEDFLNTLQKKGVTRADVTLHVGLGTFKPVEVERPEEHQMHAEVYRVDEGDANVINAALEKRRRVIAVGTTSVRTLETVATDGGRVKPDSGTTRIFLYPPKRLRLPISVLTNFHMPRSTLLLLMASIMGRDLLMQCYRHAIAERYRFFSYGDAMLVLT